MVAEELSSSAGFVTEALSCSIFETRGRFSIMTEAPLRKSDSQPEALPDSVNVREPKHFHGEERDRFLHVLQIAKTLADDDDEEFAPSEELVNQVMKSLEEEIASNCCTYYPSSCAGDNFAGPDISCGNQGQTQYSDSSVDLLYLLKASDDDLGIPPNLVLEVKDEVHLSTKETSQRLSENSDIKSAF